MIRQNFKNKDYIVVDDAGRDERMVKEMRARR